MQTLREIIIFRSARQRVKIIRQTEPVPKTTQSTQTGQEQIC